MSQPRFYKNIAWMCLGLLGPVPLFAQTTLESRTATDDRLVLETRLREAGQALAHRFRNFSTSLFGVNLDEFRTRVRDARIEIVNTEGDIVQCRSDWYQEPGGSRLRVHRDSFCWEPDESKLRISWSRLRRVANEGESALMLYAGRAFLSSMGQQVTLEAIRERIVAIERMQGLSERTFSQGTGTAWTSIEDDQVREGHSMLGHGGTARVGVSLGIDGGPFSVSPTGGVAGIASYLASFRAVPFIRSSAWVEVRGAFEAALDRPLYTVEARAGASLFPVIGGVWIAVEANQFQNVRARILRMGLPVLGGVVHQSGSDYVLVQFSVGAAFRELEFNRSTGGTDFYSDSWRATTDLAVLARLGEFFVSVGVGVEPTSDAPGDVARAAGRFSIGIPANLISDRDGIRIEAESMLFVRAGAPDPDRYPFAASLRAVWDVRF